MRPARVGDAALVLRKADVESIAVRLRVRSTDHPQIRTPRTHFVCVLSGEDARNLHDVIEVVRHPARQQLSQCHRAQCRVAAAATEIRVGKVQGREIAEALLPERCELVEQALDVAPRRLRKLREPIERLERARASPCSRTMRARGTQSVRSP